MSRAGRAGSPSTGARGRGSSLAWWRLPRVLSIRGRAPFPPAPMTMAVPCGRPPLSYPVLAGWPQHLAPAEQVEVQVENALPRIGSHVRDETPARLVDPLGAGEMGRSLGDVGQHRSVLVGEVLERRDVVLGDQQDVRGRLRIQIPEGDHPIGLPQDLGGDLSGGDLAEDAAAVVHAASLMPRAANRALDRTLARLAAELGKLLEELPLLAR